jgi:DNA polymerase-3 subunit epsilon
MLDRPLVFLDLETTGATATRDRITEIGLIEVDHGEFTGEWSTLVNPQTRIPPFIESLTGISNAMVADAPAFDELAAGLKARLDGRLLIAHNARFDYGFLKNEFARLDIRYAADVVCTVKLSRKLYPGHARHNLDSLMERHGVACEARHRALGDARVLWDLLQIWRDEHGAEAIAAAAAAQLKKPTLPAGLADFAIEDIPNGPGVYLFYGENEMPIYIGKSVDLRARVQSHFSGDLRLSKDMNITQQIRRVEWRQTAGELGALLEEARLVKDLLPTLNRQLRRTSDLHAWRWDAETGGAPSLVRAAEIDFSAGEGVYGVFRSKRAAIDALRGLAEAFELCQISIGLEKGHGPCFAHQLRRCRGVCAGKETPAQHNLRMMEALAELKLQTWPFSGRVGVREGNGDNSVLHVLDHWCYLGSVRSDEELSGLDARPAFDLDTYKILKRFLAGGRGGVEIVRLTA